MKKILNYWAVGIAVWGSLFAVVLGVAIGVSYGLKLFVEHADWKLIKSLITWLVWLHLLLAIARFFNAKARKP